MREASGKGSLIGGSLIIYAVEIRIYISKEVERVYADREEAYYFEFIL